MPPNDEDDGSACSTQCLLSSFQLPLSDQSWHRAMVLISVQDSEVEVERRLIANGLCPHSNRLGIQGDNQLKVAHSKSSHSNREFEVGHLVLGGLRGALCSAMNPYNGRSSGPEAAFGVPESRLTS